MFAGIIEAKSKVLEYSAVDPQGLVRISLYRPHSFDDINTGDSIAVNGVCLTVEKLDNQFLQFALGKETLKLTGWKKDDLLSNDVNLERSLRMGDRIHGHIVSGHVDGLAEVVSSREENGSWIVRVRLPRSLRALVWKKGSIALNGVSLTVNEIDEDDVVEVCLIPETQKRTNLIEFRVGQSITVEVDQWARAVNRANEMSRKEEGSYALDRSHH